MALEAGIRRIKVVLAAKREKRKAEAEAAEKLRKEQLQASLEISNKELGVMASFKGMQMSSVSIARRESEARRDGGSQVLRSGVEQPSEKSWSNRGSFLQRMARKFTK